MFAARLLFVGSISSTAVLGVIDDPAAPNHRHIQFAAFGAAHGDDAAIAVMIPLCALDPPPARQLAKDGC